MDVNVPENVFNELCEYKQIAKSYGFDNPTDFRKYVNSLFTRNTEKSNGNKWINPKVRSPKDGWCGKVVVNGTIKEGVSYDTKNERHWWNSDFWDIPNENVEFWLDTSYTPPIPHKEK